MDRSTTQPTDVVDLILASARRHPDRPAVTDGAETWSYARLLERARRVEGLLRERGAAAGDVVVVQGRRRPHLVAALLGVLLTDAAYLAVAEQPPPARLARVIRQTAPRVVLAEDRDVFADATRPDLPEDSARHADTPLVVVDHREAAAHPPAPDRSRADAAPDGPAYVIHTSGSTGRPKGVLVGRAALGWHARTVRDLFELQPRDRVLQAAAIDFDVAAEEIWPTLCAGACVDLLPDGLGRTGFERFTALVTERRLTVVNLPASYFSGWAAHLSRTGAGTGTLRLVVTGSEEVPVAAAQLWCAEPGRPRLLNAYGVSEATITSVACTVRPQLVEGARVPIGTALPGVTTAVVGDDGLPVPPGAPGELLLGGAGIALGYLDADGDTRFVRDGAERWYRTGDRVCEQGGLLYFLGRSDDRLKVNGVRIDPGEIAAPLAAAASVTDVRVLRAGDRLVGCLTTNGPVDTGRLLRDLRTVLPATMIPGELLVLPTFPLTPGGKVDMPALRDLAAARPADAVAPGPDDLVPLLRRVWREVLGATEIDGNSDFFALGGDSLLAARLAATLHREAGVVLRLRTVFAHPRFDDHVEQVQLLLARAGRTPIGVP
ncbi:non-ribosomal peptide synthetase [Streptomyces sp. NPDC088253]|uniref:non-ribosomal peptide synthetase n=1 Tax=Streptomyces sp. NPDC088253 TaxID=3365846 RepID=UPI00380E757B